MRDMVRRDGFVDDRDVYKQSNVVIRLNNEAIEIEALSKMKPKRQGITKDSYTTGSRYR